MSFPEEPASYFINKEKNAGYYLTPLPFRALATFKINQLGIVFDDQRLNSVIGRRMLNFRNNSSSPTDDYFTALDRILEREIDSFDRYKSYFLN